MSKKTRVHILSAVNASAVSKAGSTYTITGVCGAVDAIVMNGALYPAAELAGGAPSLEGKPAPAGHPKNAKGQHISANSGEALLSSYCGAVCRNARHEGGRTLVDVVVNEAQAKAHPDGAKLVERLDAAINGSNAEPIHVSTGLMCRMLEVNGESRGRKYTKVATDIAYDHLAILLNEQGAGTPEDGVGMFLNAAGEEEAIEVAALVMNAVDMEGAEKSLRAAIDLHQKHMDGTEPTTGKDGEKSQMRMMKMMKAALAALTDSGKSDGMGMNVAAFPEDKRFQGLVGWLRKLLGNGSDISFDQITSGLYRALPEGAWVTEVFDRHAVWTDRDGRLWRQDYAVSSDASVAFSGNPIEVTRRVDYEPVSNQSEDADIVKEQILAALNAAGIKTEGLDEAQLLAAYNALVTKPASDQLAAANAQLKTHADAAKAIEQAEAKTIAEKLVVGNSLLKVEDLMALPIARLRELDAANKSAAPIVPGTGAKPGEEFATYDLNAVYNEKGA